MKLFSKLLLLIFVISMLVTSLASCDIASLFNKDDTSDGANNDDDQNEELPPLVDYASEVKFDPNSGRVSVEVTVKHFIDGDTTHFYVPQSVSDTGVLKARYLAVNTPESTGQIEAWGKKASNFTKDALSKATSIIIESDDGKWNPDSTGERYLVWVWYKTSDSEDYRNLNLEILQAGLSKASNSTENCYGTVCAKIVDQAVSHKLYVFSQEKDPDFYYGDALPLTLKELKTNIEKYVNMRVSFEGVVVKEYDNSTVYLEEYDEETGTYFGMQVFYGYNLNSFGKNILKVGNRVRMAGSVQYYELGGTYQISDVKYDPFDTESAENIKKISEGHTGSYREIDVPTLLSGELTYEVTSNDADGNETTSEKTFDFGYIGMHSTATLKNLTVKSVYTTAQGDSKGAMTITCEDENGNEVVLRTIVLIDSTTGNKITSERFPIGAVLDAKGVIDYFDGEYQLKIFTIRDITFKN